MLPIPIPEGFSRPEYSTCAGMIVRRDAQLTAEQKKTYWGVEVGYTYFDIADTDRFQSWLSVYIPKTSTPDEYRPILWFDDVWTDWQRREQERVSAGTYLPVPWAHERWANLLHNYHFPHVSLSSPGNIAFTMSEQHGEKDRQTIMKPGRYLLRYAADWISQKDIDYYCALLAPSAYSVQYAKTRDDIARVYMNGPDSCMSKKPEIYRTEVGGKEIHPCEVYAAGDLAVAYVEIGSDIVARTLVWPEKKIFGRLYGDHGHDHRLKALLLAEGYTFAYTGSKSSLWRGAKLLKIVNDGGEIICPYLDVAGQMVTVHRTHLTLCGDSPATETSGVLTECDDERDSDDDDGTSCDHCGTYCHYDDMNTPQDGEGSYCNRCFNRLFQYCTYGEHDVRAAVALPRMAENGETICPDCWTELSGAYSLPCGHVYVDPETAITSCHCGEMIPSTTSTEPVSEPTTSESEPTHDYIPGIL